MASELYNIPARGGGFVCPVCGWEEAFLVAPYHGEVGIAGSGICSSCLFEPGFDDCHLASSQALSTVEASILAYREVWIHSGYVWRGRSSDRPSNWNGAEQLRLLLARHPDLD